MSSREAAFDQELMPASRKVALALANGTTPVSATYSFRSVGMSSLIVMEKTRVVLYLDVEHGKKFGAVMRNLKKIAPALQVAVKYDPDTRLWSSAREMLFVMNIILLTLFPDDAHGLMFPPAIEPPSELPQERDVSLPPAPATPQTMPYAARAKGTPEASAFKVALQLPIGDDGPTPETPPIGFKRPRLTLRQR